MTQQISSGLNLGLCHLIGSVTNFSLLLNCVQKVTILYQSHQKTRSRERKSQGQLVLYGKQLPPRNAVWGTPLCNEHHDQSRRKSGTVE